MNFTSYAAAVKMELPEFKLTTEYKSNAKCDWCDKPLDEKPGQCRYDKHETKCGVVKNEYCPCYFHTCCMYRWTMHNNNRCPICLPSKPLKFN